MKWKAGWELDEGINSSKKRQEKGSIQYCANTCSTSIYFTQVHEMFSIRQREKEKEVCVELLIV